MANAPAELLTMAGERGWAITRSNDEDGVARAIEPFLPREDTSRVGAEMEVTNAF